MIQQTLLVIKPDAVKRKLIGEIINRFELKGFNIIKLKLFLFTKTQAELFYSAHKNKKFFSELVSFITSGNSVAIIIKGNNAINTTRQMIGSTKSFEAEPGSIRGDYGLGISNNIVHASDSSTNFKKEQNIIFKKQ